MNKEILDTMQAIAVLGVMNATSLETLFYYKRTKQKKLVIKASNETVAIYNKKTQMIKRYWQLRGGYVDKVLPTYPVTST